MPALPRDLTELLLTFWTSVSPRSKIYSMPPPHPPAGRSDDDTAVVPRVARE